MNNSVKQLKYSLGHLKLTTMQCNRCLMCVYVFFKTDNTKANSCVVSPESYKIFREVHIKVWPRHLTIEFMLLL